MSTSVVVHGVDALAIPTFEVGEWREDLLTRLAAGARPVTLYGRRESDEVLLTAVLRSEGGAIYVSRATASAERGYHTLTTAVPSLHCFERELHEQTGIRVADHPWLKPIRYEGGARSAMDAYPFHEILGKELHEVAVGPIHAGVIEPGSFRFVCHGEQVHHLEIHLGYQHRGGERLLLEGDPRRLGPLVETIAGDTSVAHAWAYCAAIEHLSGVELAPELELARAIALELERVAMHLAGLSGMAADVGHLQGATTYGRLRTTAINATMCLCGSRFGRRALRPGGVAMKLSAAGVGVLRESVALLQRDLAIIDDAFFESKTVQHRLQSTGVLTEERARALGVVGVVARASGVAIDARQGMASGVYARHPISPSLVPDGDCWARARLRALELTASLKWLRSAIDHFPRDGADDGVGPRAPIGDLAPSRLVVTLVEGFRGEVVHCLETTAADPVRLAHYKVQDPSLRNWMGLAIAVRGNEISDFPICNKSFDLSYCGNDL